MIEPHESTLFLTLTNIHACSFVNGIGSAPAVPQCGGIAVAAIANSFVRARRPAHQKPGLKRTTLELPQLAENQNSPIWELFFPQKGKTFHFFETAPGYPTDKTSLNVQMSLARNLHYLTFILPMVARALQKYFFRRKTA